jgi:hypothetical protein
MFMFAGYPVNKGQAVRTEGESGSSWLDSFRVCVTRRFLRTVWSPRGSRPGRLGLLHPILQIFLVAACYQQNHQQDVEQGNRQ